MTGTQCGLFTHKQSRSYLNHLVFIYLFLFFTCFGHPCAHHQEQIAVSMRHWYMSLCMGDDWSTGWIFNPDQKQTIQSDNSFA